MTASWLRQPVFAGFLLLAGTVGLAIGFAVGLTALGLVPSPWLPALILSTTSLGIVVPVLREKGISGSIYGQTILLAALIADFATMVLITVVVALLSGGLTLDVLLIGVLLLAFLLARPFRPRLHELAARAAGHRRPDPGHGPDPGARRAGGDVHLRGAVRGAGRRGDPGRLPGRRSHLAPLQPRGGRRRGGGAPQAGRHRLRLHRAHLLHHGGRSVRAGGAPGFAQRAGARSPCCWRRPSR